jgi:hypothetical protein
MTARVVVLGGTGFFGRYLVDDLRTRTNADVVVAARHVVNDPDAGQVACDVFDRRSLLQVCDGADVIVHCAGPFQAMPILPLDVSLEVGAHYVDISEDRAFASEVAKRQDLARDRGIVVLNGCSVVPTMSIVVALHLAGPFAPVSGVRTFAAPDTAKSRGRAMFSTMLWGAGRPFDLLRDGELHPAVGWSEPEWVEFPPPIGRRLLYLVSEMADLDAVPAATGARTVEFKAGSEHPALNRLLSVAARFRHASPNVDLGPLVPLAQAIAWLFGRMGRDRGAAMFEVSGRRDGVEARDLVAFMADGDGGRIPILPGAIAVEALLNSEFPEPGLVSPDTWLSGQRLLVGAWARGLRVVRSRVC